MKFLTVTQDGGGIVHFDFTRAPDLRRREYAQSYGSARILYCCISTSEMCHASVIDAFARCFADRENEGGFEISPSEAILAAAWLGQIKPALYRRLHGLRRLIVRPAKTFFFGKWRRVKTLKQRFEALK